MQNKTLPLALKAAACVLAMTFGYGALGAASAAPIPISFTWNPDALGLGSPQFTANFFDLDDFATISVPANPSAPGAVSETGYLLPTTFLDNGTTVSVANAPLPGSWGIYEQFTATSHLSSCSTGLCGAFDSVTANVYAYSTASGVASVSFSSSHMPVLTLPGGVTPTLIATETGPIGSSPNVAQITSGVPTASVDTAFTPTAAGAGFFVSPTFDMVLDLDQSFTNTTGAITTFPSPCGPIPGTACIFEINAGGGNGNFYRIGVPEPRTLAVLGIGVLGLGLVRRRRNA